MRNVLLVAMCVLAAGAAQAADYVWSAGATSQNYNTVTAYTPNLTLPLTTADRLIMDNGAGGLAAHMVFPGASNATTYTLGGLEIDCGTLDFQNTSATIRLVGGNGQNGDLIVRYSGQLSGYGNQTAGVPKTFDVDGNVYIEKGVYTGYTSYSLGYSALVMRGVGKTLDVLQTTAPDQSWKAITIYDCASISSVRYAATANLTVNGTITGGDWYVGPKAVGIANTSVIKLGPNGAMTGGRLFIMNFAQPDLTGTQYVDLGGGTYPSIEADMPNSYWGRQVIRLKGDVSTTSNLSFMKQVGYYSSSEQTLIDTDNGSGKVSNLTIGGNLDMDGAAVGGTNHYAGIRGRTATINVNGNATFGRYGYIVGDCSTWNFKGNVTFTTNYKYDNSSLGATTFNITGTGAQNLDFGNTIPVGKKLPLGSLVINKASGTATLTDNVLLLGNFKIASGTFASGNYYVNFQGGQGNIDNAQQLDANGATVKKIAIMQGSPTSVKLMSDLTVTDNLDIYSGCTLYLNGHNLFASSSDLKQDFLNSFAGSYQVREGGLIVGNIPEPATLLLLGSGALGALGWMRRRKLS